MYKKDFIELAKAIKLMQDRDEADSLCDVFIKIFAKYNKRFSVDKFKTACGSQ